MLHSGRFFSAVWPLQFRRFFKLTDGALHGPPLSLRLLLLCSLNVKPEGTLESLLAFASRIQTSLELELVTEQLKTGTSQFVCAGESS